ncbi:MAG: ATP synthase F0 subunit C [Pseudobdellovibrionaceae bacterium]
MKQNLKNMTYAALVLAMSSSAFAEEAATAASAPTVDRGLVAIAAALAICVSVVGGAIAQGRTASTALEGIARNPAASGKLLIPMILGLALIESLVIYALIIALKLTA